MSYAQEAKRAGRRPLTLVELESERCTLTYGTAPCTAAIGVTGPAKCYNTRATCQDAAHYTPTTVVRRYCEVRADLPLDLDAIPSLRSVSTAPTKLDIGESLGQRASATITLEDHPYHDRGLDPYIADRAAPAAGTFWGRWRARNPYYFGRICRIKTGYISDAGFDEANFITRTYVIEKFDGPDSGGKVTITAKDVLKLADDDRAQAPAPSTGVLLSGIDADDTSATLAPAGIGDSEYPADGWVRMGSEICAFTRAGDALTLTRGQFNTEADAHDAEESVQVCLRYAAQHLDAICADLLGNYAKLPAEYLPLDDWAAEVSAYLPRTYSTLITEPTGVKSLLTELVQQAPFYLWWDERLAQIRLRAIRGPDPDAPMLTDNANFIEGSVTVSDKADAWLSRVYIYFGQVDPTVDLQTVSNYRQFVVYAQPGAETPETNNRSQKKTVYSRWLTSKNGANELGAQLIDRFGETPRQVTFSVDAKDYALWTGDVFRMQTRTVQGADGTPATLIAQIIEAAESVNAHSFKHTALAFRYALPLGVERIVTITADTFNFNLLTAYTALYGSPTGPVIVTCIIDIDVKVGSTSNTAPSFDVGAFPGGSTLKLENNGRIQGAGGLGVIVGDDDDRDGLPGGTAFKTALPITIDNLGEIWGGGGGGGYAWDFVAGGHRGKYGGGGGSGYVPGLAETAADDGYVIYHPGEDGTTEAGGAGYAVLVGPGGGVVAFSGGDGGAPGEAGHDAQGDSQKTDGGAAGKAVDGNAFITWLAAGDRRGPIT